MSHDISFLTLNPRILFPIPLIFGFPPDLVMPSPLQDSSVCCSKGRERKAWQSGA